MGLVGLCLWMGLLPTIPDNLVFCGMQTRIEPEARVALEAYITKLYEHPPTLQAIVARAETLLPYIEEALAYIGVPEDLKYLSIQESRLNPYAVSRSGAVGYWQFKDYTAREMGLVLNDTLDERKHLFRSSAAAALYLLKQYNRHRNWLFAIVAYYEGGTGAIPYLDSVYLGKAEVCIKATTHWYAMRALAHKLVFESLVKRRIYALRPVAYRGPTRPAWEVARQHGLSPDSFLLLNPWLLKPILPASRLVTYYVPLDTLPDTLPREPLKGLFTPAPIPAAFASVPANFQYSLPTDTTPGPSLAPAPSPPPPRNPPPRRDPSAAAYLPLLKEPYLHQEWEYPPPSLTSTLRRWNPFYKGQAPVLIVPPSRAHIHIVQSGETPAQIARHYRRPLQKLLAYNYLSRADTSLPRGLRLYLRQARPYDERPLIYQW